MPELPRDVPELLDEVSEVRLHAVARRQLIQTIDFDVNTFHLVGELVPPSTLAGGGLLSLLPTIPFFSRLVLGKQLDCLHLLVG